MADMRFRPTRLGTIWRLAAIVPLAWLFWRLLSDSAWLEVAVLALLVLFGHRILIRLRELSHRESERHYRMAMEDSLTGFYTRNFLLSRLDEEDQRVRRYGGCFALLMLDLDGFKQINDSNGHLAGDHYLREIAETIREQLRAADIPCRYGGDEFCLLPPQTGISGARAIAERIRTAVASRAVELDDRALRTTVSIGLAVFPRHGTGDLHSLMRKADEALYRAKGAGRDRVVPFAA